MPLTFLTLTVLSLFCAFILIRTRVGLIYEAAKMNALLGLPMGRVQHIAPLSVFFIMQSLVSIAGGASGALFTLFMIHPVQTDATTGAVEISGLVGVGITLGLMVLYVSAVAYIASEEKLRAGTK